MNGNFVIGLVVEGPTDYKVIKSFIIEAFSKASIDKNIIFRDIQPELDATGTNHKRAGWPRLLAWCRRFPPSVRKSQLFNPLFNHIEALDLLIVQLDGDVLSAYACHCSEALPSKPWDSIKRGNFVESVLEEWLWPESSNEERDKHVLLATVQDTEAWLVAGLNTSINDPEERCSSNELSLIASSLPVRLRFPRKKLKKEPDKWGVMADRAIKNLLHIRSVCPHCDKFLNAVEVAALKK